MSGWQLPVESEGNTTLKQTVYETYKDTRRALHTQVAGNAVVVDAEGCGWHRPSGAASDDCVPLSVSALQPHWHWHSHWHSHEDNTAACMSLSFFRLSTLYKCNAAVLTAKLLLDLSSLHSLSLADSLDAHIALNDYLDWTWKLSARLHWNEMDDAVVLFLRKPKRAIRVDGLFDELTWLDVFKDVDWINITSEHSISDPIYQKYLTSSKYPKLVIAPATPLPSMQFNTLLSKNKIYKSKLTATSFLIISPISALHNPLKNTKSYKNLQYLVKLHNCTLFFCSLVSEDLPDSDEPDEFKVLLRSTLSAQRDWGVLDDDSEIMDSGVVIHKKSLKSALKKSVAWGSKGVVVFDPEDDATSTGWQIKEDEDLDGKRKGKSEDSIIGSSKKQKTAGFTMSHVTAKSPGSAFKEALQGSK